MLIGQEPHDQFGHLLRTLRRGGGLTQEELAEASGSSVRAIREMENGRVRAPQRRTAALLADALALDGADRRRFLELARAERFVAPEAARDLIPTDRSEGRDVVPGELPAALPDLTGRHAELDTLGSGTEALAVLHGPPGVGKTSLAIAAGHLLSPAFPDGQLFVDLHGASQTERVEPAEALAGLLRSLGLVDDRMPESPAGRAGLFRTLTRDRRILVVLDNAADEAQVRPLLPAGRHCRTLITSRRPLAGLAGALRVPLGVLEPAAGRRLLTSVLGTDRVSAEPAAVDLLVKLCGRLPLAIRIAGNRLASRPQWSVQQLVEQLRDQRRRLTALTAGDLDVRAAFDVSYRQLAPVTAEVFRRAALVPGADFDAEVVAAAAGTSVEQAAAATEELVDAGLLLSLGDRYRFHDLVRLYAHERLDGEDPPAHRDRAHDRMVTWLLRRTEQAGAMFEPSPTMFEPSPAPPGSPFPNHQAAAAWLDRESVNWSAALRDAARHGRHTDVVRVARRLHWFSDTASHRHSWDEIFSLGVAAARACRSPRDEAALLNCLGWARYHCRERNEDGLAALDQALELARRIGDRREEAWALTYSAVVLVRTGRPGHALDPSRRAVGLFREIGYGLGEQSAASATGHALAALGRFAEAADVHQEVLRFYRECSGLSSTGALVAQACTRMNLGADLAGLESFHDSAAEYSRARGEFRRCGQTFGEAMATYRSGLAFQSLGDPAAATAELSQALALFCAASSPWWEARTLHALAALAEGEPGGAGRAQRLRQRALDRCGDLDADDARTLRATLRRELAG